MIINELKSLSVVIISHNQREVLRRCIESILKQKTDFPVEIIVSDDRSSDGTKEMLLTEYGDKIKSTFFNSDEYETSFTLERAALNRINGLKLATGKYLIHIDGDDFFTGKDLFQKMVDTLEMYSECTMCCQNYKIVPYNKLETTYESAVNNKLFETESVLSASQFVVDMPYLPNSCFCMRRLNAVKLDELTSTTYDDVDITFRYLGKGTVALLDRNDFIYVQYPDSTCATMSDADKSIIFNSGLTSIQLAPHLAGVLIRKNLISLLIISKMAIFGGNFSDNLLKYCSQFDLFVFNGLSNKISLKSKIRFIRIYLLSKFVYTFNVTPKFILRRLYKLSVKETITNNVVI